MDVDEAVRIAGAGFERTLAGLQEAEWDRRACGEWNVRQVTNHVVGSVLMYSLLLQGADGSELTSLRDEDHLGGDPVSALTANVSRLAAAIRQASALDGQVRHPRAEIPAAWLPVMATEELVVHGWDIGRATNDEATIDEDLAAWLVPSLEEIIPTFRSAGVFSGASGEPPPGASAGERLLHMTGRGQD